MLDRLLFSLGSAAIGGVLMYLLWSFATRRLARRRVVRQAARAETPRQQQAAEAPAQRPEMPRMPAQTMEGLSDIKNSLAELARAQVAIMEHLEEARDDPGNADDDEDRVTARLVALSAKLDAMAERIAPEKAVADGMDALDGRLAAIEDRLGALGADGDSAGRNEALAGVMDALATRLEGVETGLGNVLNQVAAASADAGDADAQADALRAVLESALPVDALSRLEGRLGAKLAALSERLETSGAASAEMPTALDGRLGAIEAQLAAVVTQRDGQRAALESLSAGLAGLKEQLERPAEIAFSEEALSELQDSLRAMLAESGELAGQGTALAKTLTALETRLDRMQGQLDELTSERSVGRTLEMIGAISTLQTDTARLKGGIEQGFDQIGEITGDSAERIAALAARIAALEAQIEASHGGGGSEDASALAQAIADLIADRLAAAAAMIEPEAESRRDADAAPAESAVSAVFGAADADDAPAAPEPSAPQMPTLLPSAAALEETDTQGDDARIGHPRPTSLAAHPRGGAEFARVESAMLRARPGLAAVIGQHAHQKPNGGEF